jgi:hypothetical protein
MDLRPLEIGPLFPDSVFVKRGVGELMMCLSHRKAWRKEEVLWCGGALLVTLSVIYFEFKAHLTSMASTAYCSDTPFHLVCA